MSKSSVIIQPTLYFNNETGHALDVYLNGAIQFVLPNGEERESTLGGRYSVPGLSIQWSGKKEADAVTLTFTHLGIDKPGKVLTLKNGTQSVLKIAPEIYVPEQWPKELEPEEEKLFEKGNYEIGHSLGEHKFFDFDWEGVLDARIVVVPHVSKKQ